MGLIAASATPIPAEPLLALAHSHRARSFVGQLAGSRLAHNLVSAPALAADIPCTLKHAPVTKRKPPV
jgi:hypothetical protein